MAAASVLKLRPDTKRQRAARGSGLYARNSACMKDLTMENLNLYADLRSVTGEIRERPLPVCWVTHRPRPFHWPSGGEIVRRDEAKLGWPVRWSANRKCCCWMNGRWR